MINFSSNDSASAAVRGVTIFGVGNVIIRIVDFVIAIFILRWLSIFEFGLYRLVLSAQDLFSGFFLSGLDNVVVSDVSRGLQRDEREARSLYTTFLGFLILIGVLLWALFFFGNNIFLSRFGIAEESAKIISFLFLLAPLETIYNLKFSILLDFGWGTVYRVIRDFSRLGSLVVLLSYFSLGIDGALWSLVFARLLPLGIILIAYHRDSFLILPTIFEIKNSLKILFFRHGKWALLDDFIMNIGKNIRPFIIKYFAGVEAVAIFSVAQNLLAHSSSLFPIRDVLTPIFPRIADDSNQLISKINRSVKYSIWAHIAVSIAAAIGSPILVYLFFPKYMPALPLFYILLIGLPFLGFRSVLLPVFYALRQQKILFRLTVFRLALIALLSIILVSILGVWGAALESLLMGIILTPVFARALHKILPDWRFSIQDLILLDNYDKEFISDLRKRFLGIFNLGDRKTN